MRLRLALLGALLASLPVPQAAASDPGTVRIGRSIGAVRLGMSEAAVVQTYGEPAKRSTWTLPGKSGPVLEYAVHRGRLRVFSHSGSVVSIETTSPYYRLANGIGVGTVTPRRRSEFSFRWRGFTYGMCSGTYSREAYRSVTELVLPFGARTGRRIIAISVTRRSFRLLSPGAARCD